MQHRRSVVRARGDVSKHGRVARCECRRPCRCMCRCRSRCRSYQPPHHARPLKSDYAARRCASCKRRRRRDISSSSRHAAGGRQRDLAVTIAVGPPVAARRMRCGSGCALTVQCDMNHAGRRACLVGRRRAMVRRCRHRMRACLPGYSTGASSTFLVTATRSTSGARRRATYSVRATQAATA